MARHVQVWCDACGVSLENKPHEIFTWSSTENEPLQPVSFEVCGACLKDLWHTVTRRVQEIKDHNPQNSRV